ncbi:MAG: glycoside hydrolase family 95 protein [Oscillospiraceae bacterium]|nr:glycoside hydrolase family 95 protein [Oscillospiraceae bacterium]
MSSTLLKYSRLAANWDEALPVGNGRLGGMVFGIPREELIQLNEDSIWSGGYRDRNNPLALENLDKMRRLIVEGRSWEAEKLCDEAFYGTNENQRHYQPLGDFHLIQTVGEATEYSRSLDISTALCDTVFVSDGIRYVRRVFASHPDEVIVISLTAEKDGKPYPAVSFSAFIDGRDDNYDKNQAYDKSTLIFTVSDGIPYACAISAAAKDGTCETRANRIVCENASCVVITIGAQTSWRTGDYENMAVRQAKTALRRTSELESRHIKDYQSLYNRCGITLCDNSGGGSDLPTDERLAAVKEGKPDNELYELYFNFSRYLMISGSREGTLPLNLQGIWNKDMWPAWGCKFTININTEMNYWGVEMQNLSRCHMPLFDHIERMREHGRITAEKMYGCHGAVCHHNTDIWGDTAPQDKWLPGTIWPMGLAWLCTHIWEHYQFTLDKEFLAEKYDTMREAAEFFTEYLIDDGKGRLVVSPSVSPENTYNISEGVQGRLCQGASMDSQILHTLFKGVISAADILQRDKAFADKLREIDSKLPSPQIGKYGQIMEWAEDYDEFEPGHRHISQLFALHPSDIISLSKTPELAKAARATIERRLSYGGGNTGWSRAWIINMWARLGDGEKVAENLKTLMSDSTSINMFDMHPPFQIDGNFGGGAGIGEALLQSIAGEIAFLPALPPAWTEGSVRRMAARGGLEISFEWSGSRVNHAQFTARSSDGINRLVLRETVCCNSPKEINAVTADGNPVGYVCENADGICTVIFNENIMMADIDF